MSDVYLITGAQSRMARSLLKWSREKLAEEANVARGTIRIFEDDQPIRESIVLDIQSVFDANGVECCPDGSVRPRSDNIKDFRGLGGCDRFFANIEKLVKEINTGVVCRIGSQKMMTRVTGRNGMTNFERLENLSKIAHVRCLLSDQRIYLPGTPSFEVKVYPENRPSIISSEFAYGEEATFAVDQDDRFHFCHPAYMVLEYPSLAKRMFEYFEEHWLDATPYLPSKKGSTNCGHRSHAVVTADCDEQKRRACY
ncbi:MAG: hypothetical protein AB7S81_01615 [Bdellovibrionales bacterium]